MLRLLLKGEHESLNAIHSVVPSFCPASLGWGRFSGESSKFFLVTEFLELSRGGTSYGPSLAAKLAKLHTTPAPTPSGHSSPMFGFPVTTCCGGTPQPNDFKKSWADFFAENRLHAILKRSETTNGQDSELHNLVTTTIGKVVPALLRNEHLNGGKGVTPVIVHGDLWSGNASKGRVGSEEGDLQDVVFDPSACYAHNEYELGIMGMFGGFGREFYKEYHALCPKTEPVDEYEDRVKLYEL